MMLSRHRLIFLAVPKTGANAVQTLLQPLSDDRKVLDGGLDGVDRFGVVGPVTPHKHATLAEYAAVTEVAGLRVALTVREPFARAISFYFSPHRWDGRSGPPAWSASEFLALLPHIVPAADFLKVDGQHRRPDWLLRFESLQADFGRLVREAGLPLPDATLPRVNRSKAADAEREAARNDGVARAAVREVFAEDYALFDYP